MESSSAAWISVPTASVRAAVLAEELVLGAAAVAAAAVVATIVSVAVVDLVSVVAVVSGSRATTLSLFRSQVVSVGAARVSAEAGATVSALEDGFVSTAAILTRPRVAESTGVEAEAESASLELSAVGLVSTGAFGAYA